MLRTMGPTLAATLALILLASPAASASPRVRDLTDAEAVHAARAVAPRESAKRASMTGTSVKIDAVTMVVADAESASSRSVDGDEVLEGRNVDFVVGATADGFQVLSVVAGPQSPRLARYVFPGMTLTQEEGGSIAVRKDGRYGEPVAFVDAPWAKDAHGVLVSTVYSISRSDTLVQTVSPAANAAYPVVADPRIRTAWYGWSIEREVTTMTTTQLLLWAGGLIAVVTWLVVLFRPRHVVRSALLGVSALAMLGIQWFGGLGRPFDNLVTLVIVGSAVWIVWQGRSRG